MWNVQVSVSLLASQIVHQPQYVPRNLGIDDLAVTVRPGPSLHQLIATLEASDRHNQSIDDGEGQAKEKAAAKGKSSLDGRGRALASVEIIQPSAPPSGSTGDSNTRRHHFQSENLCGCGDAGTWARESRQRARREQQPIH
jgi:hypothetical protein